MSRDLELVLADDYEQDGENELSFRALTSAASCFWRAGQRDKAQELFDALRDAHPDRSGEIQQMVEELERDE